MRQRDTLATRRSKGVRPAQRFKAVLDRRLSIDREAISPLSAGNRDDGLPLSVEQVGTIPGPSGVGDPVRLVRRAKGAPNGWLFSRATTRHIDGWYDRLEHRWAVEHLPNPLLNEGAAGLFVWQWMGLVVLVLGALMITGFLLSRTTRLVLARVVTRTAANCDDAILSRAPGPLTVAWALGLAYMVSPWLGLPHSPPRAAAVGGPVNKAG